MNMSKFKGDNNFANGNAKFGCTTLLLHPMPVNWDFSKIKQFVKDHCESDEIKNSAFFLFKERTDSDRVWIQFDSESLCRLAYAKLQGMELNGKKVNIKFDKRKNTVQKPGFDKKPNSNPANMNMNNVNMNSMNMNMSTMNMPNPNMPNNNFNNFTPTPPVGDMEPPPVHDTYGLSVGFLNSLGIQPPMRNKVFVANLVLTVTERDIRDVMSLAGRVTNVTLLRSNGARGQATVEFDHPVEAVQAISMLNGQEFYGRPLVVRMNKPEPKLTLPTGLGNVGMGLGVNGEPLRSVRTAVEIRPLKHRLENAIKRLSSGDIPPDDNYVIPYGSAVVDNFNHNMPFGPGMPPFGMPNGPMPFMPFPPDQMNGPFMPGPMGMPGPMPGPMGMPGPNMGMPGPNMPMPGPMGMPGPNMPMPGPNMPIPGPNMPMPGSNMPIPGPNMPIPGPNMSMPVVNKPGPMPGSMGAPKLPPPVTPNKAAITPITIDKKIPSPKLLQAEDIPGLSEIKLPKTPPVKAKSPPTLPSNVKKLMLSLKSEKMIMGKVPESKKAAAEGKAIWETVLKPKKPQAKDEKRSRFSSPGRESKSKKSSRDERRSSSSSPDKETKVKKSAYRKERRSSSSSPERERKVRKSASKEERRPRYSSPEKESKARKSTRDERRSSSSSPERERKVKKSESKERRRSRSSSSEKERKGKKSASKEERRPRYISPEKETKVKKSVSREKRLRSRSSSPEKETKVKKPESKEKVRSSSPEKEAPKSAIEAYKNNELTNDLLKLFESKKTPSMDMLQGFMDQVISLSKTMSALRDIVPQGASRVNAPSPERSAKTDHSEAQRKEKRTDLEVSRLTKTISALRDSKVTLPVQKPESIRARDNEWSPDSHTQDQKLNMWTDFEIVPPPPKDRPKEPRAEPPARPSAWSAAAPPRSPGPPDARRREHKRTRNDEPESSRFKARKTDALPLITSSDMLNFSNLPPTVTLAALSEKMRAVGELWFAELTGAGRAVVRFRHARDAERCTKLFHRSKVDGQIIEVVPF